MTTKTGKSEQIRAFVAQHQGCLRAEILDAFGLGKCSSLIAYMLRKTMIVKRGSHGLQRYFTDECIAAERWPGLDAADKAMRTEKKRARHDRATCRFVRARETALHAPDGRLLKFVLEDGVTLAQNVSITVAPLMRERWHPERGWHRAITADWLKNRLSV